MEAPGEGCLGDILPFDPTMLHQSIINIELYSSTYYDNNSMFRAFPPLKPAGLGIVAPGCSCSPIVSMSAMNIQGRL